MSDVLIIGAGLTGLSLACAMAHQGREVVILDRAPRPKISDPWARVNAYNRQTESLLRHLGIWERIDEEMISPFESVWVGQREDGYMSLDAKTVHANALGHFIPNAIVIEAMLQALDAMPNVHLHWETVPDQLVTSIEGVRVRSKDASWSASLLVGADGQRSWVREHAGITWTSRAYHQHCLVGTLKIIGSHDQVAWQRFLPTGPLGMLPLNNERYSLAWSVESEEAMRLHALSDQDFLRALMDQDLYEGIEGIGEIYGRAAFPLSSGRSQRYFAHRLVLVGDAAHAVHPLAGLGANMGFKDVKILSECLENVDLTSDIDSFLLQYERKVKFDHALMEHALASINQAFSQDHPMLSKIRGLILTLGDRSPWMKRLMLEQAMWL